MTTIPSTTIITNLKNATAPTANTLKSARIGGLDMPGMLALALSKAIGTEGVPDADCQIHRQRGS